MLRNPIVAGMFYPGSPAQTASEAALLTSPSAGEEDKVRARMLVLPHAGWVYSGRVAGMVIARAEIPQDLIVLAPCHRVRGKGLGVWDKGVWKTPLGDIPVNEELSREILAANGGFQVDYAAHEQDHAIEVLLPLLQIARPDITIVPIAVSDPSPAHLLQAGKALAEVIKSRESEGKQAPLLVVSSDMSHYISDAAAKKQDAKALEAIMKLDGEGLYRAVGENNISMCGVLPATLALQACRDLGAEKAELVSYATSGQVSGDMDKVVGYAGVMVY